MGVGILVCGLNGSGKSTLGKALAEKLGFHFIDNEDLFFPKKDPAYSYTAPRSAKEVEQLLLEEILAHDNFIFAAVRGNYGEKVLPFYRYAVLVNVPKDIRMQRVRNRSFEKFGERILPGGDLYQQEQQFFDMVDARPDNYTEEWLDVLACPKICVDGRLPVEENIALIMDWMQGRPCQLDKGGSCYE